MKVEKYKKLIAMLMVTLVLIPVFGNFAEAKINQSYYESIKTVAVVNGSWLSDMLTSDILIGPLGKLIYSIGNIIEYLVGAVMLAATGTSIFPWADAIVFNAIPLLDVNFISPDNNSIWKSGGSLQLIIKNMYASLFSLAELFFGIAVALMAIKLALSSIASDKARYKDALVKWLIGLILLFGIQFFISFVFYLNENLTQFASDLVTDEIKKNYSDFMASLDKNSVTLTDQQIVTNFGKSKKSIIDIAFKTDNAKRCDYLIELASKPNTKSLRFVAYLLRSSDFKQVTNEKEMARSIISWLWFVCDFNDTPKTGYSAKAQNKVPGKDTIGLNLYLDEYQEHGRKYFESQYELHKRYYNADKSDRDQYKLMIRAKAVMEAYDYAEGKIDASNSEIAPLITGIGVYFKEASFAYENNGWKKTDVVVENAILYALLVLESIALLIQYVKRLFFVIILALSAPIVVVYDFAKKI